MSVLSSAFEASLEEGLSLVGLTLSPRMPNDRDDDDHVRLTTLSPDALHSITRSLEAGCASADTLNTRLPVLHRLH